MSTPKAAFTFDTTRVYLTQRDNAAPGSGTWAAPTTIFDGVLQPAFASFTTMSAGALDETEAFGILATSRSGLSYLGNGSPDTPRYVSFAGQIGTPFSSDYWDMSQGAWTIGGNKYAAVEDGTNIQIIKSTNNGVTWAAMNSAGKPNIANNNAAIQRIDSKIYILGADNGTGNWGVYSFDTATDTWNGLLTTTFSAPSTINGLNDWSGGLFKYLNGDFGVVYTHSGVGVVYREYASGAWSAEVSVPGGSFANAVIDPGLAKIHVFAYAANSRLGIIHYSTVAHGGTVTPDIFIIPAPIGISSADGIGHPSILNSMIFAPRDDSNDHANSVWVALLSNGQFLKELLPVPADALNSIGNATLNAGGAGYAVGDTGTINGTTNPGTYQITAVAAGVVTGFFINTGGGAYSIANAIATTTGGLQPGVGTGFKVNITALIAQPVPTCVYMMYPNGYSLASSLSLACPVSNTVTAGVPYAGTLVETGGTGPFTYAIVGGSLPPGFSLNPSTGAIAGITTALGAWSYTAQVTDSLGATARATCSFGVASPIAPGGCAEQSQLSVLSPGPGLSVAGTAPPSIPGQTNSLKSQL